MNDALRYERVDNGTKAIWSADDGNFAWNTLYLPGSSRVS